MKVKYKKLDPSAMISKAHSTDAGFDLKATSKTYDEHDNVVYGTGLAFEIPEGYVGYLFPRSSNAKTSLLLSNSVGVIDAGYRGEVLFKFKRGYFMNINGELYHDVTNEYKVGDRIGQLIIMPFPSIEFEEASELSQSERGTGGYGSSGK